MSECLYMFYLLYVSVSSPYVLVFGNDRVICYTRAYDVAGGSSET